MVLIVSAERHTFRLLHVLGQNTQDFSYCSNSGLLDVGGHRMAASCLQLAHGLLAACARQLHHLRNISQREI